MTLHARFLWTVAALAFAATPLPLHTASTHPAPPQATHDAAPSEPVDINSASVEQLMKLPGLTRTWAGRIVRYRPYRGKNELLDRGVVSGAIYARISSRIIAHRQAR